MAATMIPPFDLFRIVDGNPLWVGTAITLEEARLQVRSLHTRLPGEYLIVSLKTGHKESIIDGGISGPSGRNPLR
jgi:hypothetical protein